MTNLYIQTRRRRRESVGRTRHVEWKTRQIGKTESDMSGKYSLYDGTPVVIDVQRINPLDEIIIGNIGRRWPVRLNTEPLTENMTVYQRRMSEGVTVLVGENGVGRKWLTERNRLVLQLGQPVLERNGIGHYPDYPELSSNPGSPERG